MNSRQLIVGTVRDAQTESVFSLWRTVLMFGVISGLGQWVLVTVARLATHQLIRISSDALWTVPAANTIIFGCVATALNVATRRLEQTTARIVILSVLL